MRTVPVITLRINKAVSLLNDLVRIVESTIEKLSLSKNNESQYPSWIKEQKSHLNKYLYLLFKRIFLIRNSTKLKIIF